MKSEVTSTTKRFLARAMKFTRNAVLIATQAGDNITITRPDGIPNELDLPEVGTVLRDMAVTLSGAGDKLYGFYPAKGLHVVQFHSFQHRKNEVPAPMHLQAQPPSGTRKFATKERDVFNANLVILEGDYAGCLLPWSFLPYAFDRDVDGTAKFKGSKNEIEKCAKFLTLCGFDAVNEVMDYSPNLLPELEQILSERADEYPFQVGLKMSEKGTVYIDTAEELPAGWGKRSSKKVADDPFAGLEDDAEEDVVDEAIERNRAKAKAALEDDDFEDEEEVPTPKRNRDIPVSARKPTPIEEDETDFDDEDELPAPPPARRARTQIPKDPEEIIDELTNTTPKKRSGKVF